MFILSIILARTTFTQVALGTLYVSLVVIILYLIYQRFLNKINVDEPNQENYCELIYLENDLAKGIEENNNQDRKKTC